MKKSELYFKTVSRRRNTIGEALLGFFLGISSWPRLLLEVFVRRNMGERYYSDSAAITLVVLLALLPLFTVGAFNGFYGGMEAGLFLKLFFTWYAFLTGFMYMAAQRSEEVKRLPGVFDFARFSLSSGRIDRHFYDIEFWGKSVSVRTIETVLEPGLFFSIGFVLIIMGQPVGSLLVLCSIIYSMSYRAAYAIGDNFIMDKIDERICNEELVKSFVDGDGQGDTRGFNFRCRRPADPDARRQVAEILNEEEETVEAL